MLDYAPRDGFASPLWYAEGIALLPKQEYIEHQKNQLVERWK